MPCRHVIVRLRSRSSSARSSLTIRLGSPGGVYLVWIGIQVWRSPAIGVRTDEALPKAGGWCLFRTGFLTAASNPKCILFFTALLPQFIDPGRGLILQFAIMSITYGVTEFVVEYAFASAANRMSAWLARGGKRFNQRCGGVFIAVGAAPPLRSSDLPTPSFCTLQFSSMTLDIPASLPLF